MSDTRKAIMIRMFMTFALGFDTEQEFEALLDKFEEEISKVAVDKYAEGLRAVRKGFDPGRHCCCEFSESGELVHGPCAAHQEIIEKAIQKQAKEESETNTVLDRAAVKDILELCNHISRMFVAHQHTSLPNEELRVLRHFANKITPDISNATAPWWLGAIVQERLDEIDAEAEAFNKDCINAASRLAEELGCLEDPDGWCPWGVYDQCVEEIRELKESNKSLRETTVSPGSNDEWMRLFGRVWYREDIYKQAIADTKASTLASCARAVRKLSGMASAYEDAILALGKKK